MLHRPTAALRRVVSSPLAIRLAFLVLFFGAVLAGRATRPPGSQLAMLWPAAAVGFLWLSRSWSHRRSLALDATLMVVASTAGSALTGAPLPLALLLAPATTVHVLVCCAAVSRFETTLLADRALRRPHDLLALVTGSLAGAAVSGLIGPVVLAVATGEPLLAAEITWVLRNAVSTVVVVGALGQLGGRGGDGPRRAGRPRRVEAVAVVVVSAVAYAVAFWDQTGLPLAYTVIPLCVWVGLRLSTRAATLHVVAGGAFVVTATWLGHGPFGATPLNVRVPLAQSFLGIAGVLTLVLALHRDERVALHADLVEAGTRNAEQADLLALVLDEVASSRDSLAGILDAATEQAIVGLDLAGEITFFNHGAERLTGLDAEAAVGSHLTDLVDPVEIAARAGELGLQPGPAVLTAVAAVARHETRRWILRRADGANRLVQFTVTAVRADHGGITGFIALGTDVTAQVEAEGRLAESEQVFRLTFDLAPVGMAMVSLSPGDLGRLITVNRSFAQFTGREEAQLLTMRGSELMHPDEREAHRDVMALLVDGSVDRLTTERRFLTPAGEERWGSLSTAVVHPGGGRDSYLVVLVEDVTERKHAQQELTRLALHDSLTGLPNRRLFRDRLEQALAGQVRTGADVGLLYLDLDGFKAVNDHLGHAAGDELLVTVADRLRRCVRVGDTLARLGGDEFAVVCPDLSSAADAHRIARRILTALGEPVELRDGTAAVGVSIGISVGDGDVDGEGLVHQADAAMYRAKRAGKGRIVVHDGDRNDAGVDARGGARLRG